MLRVSCCIAMFMLCVTLVHSATLPRDSDTNCPAIDHNVDCSTANIQHECKPGALMRNCPEGRRCCLMACGAHKCLPYDVRDGRNSTNSKTSITNNNIHREAKHAGSNKPDPKDGPGGSFSGTDFFKVIQPKYSDEVQPIPRDGPGGSFSGTDFFKVAQPKNDKGLDIDVNTDDKQKGLGLCIGHNCAGKSADEKYAGSNKPDPKDGPGGSFSGTDFFKVAQPKGRSDDRTIRVPVLEGGVDHPIMSPDTPNRPKGLCIGHNCGHDDREREFNVPIWPQGSNTPYFIPRDKRGLDIDVNHDDKTKGLGL